MPLVQIIAASLAGAFAFACLLHMAAGLGSGRDRRSLWIAATCLAALAFILLLLLAIREPDPYRFATYNQWGLACSALVFPLLLKFFDAEHRYLPKLAWWVLGAALTTMFVANAVLPFGLQFSALAGTRANQMAWGETIYSLHGTIHPMFPLAALVAATAGGACAWVQWRKFALHRQRVDLLMGIGAWGFLASMVLGIASRLGYLNLHFAGVIGLAFAVLAVSLVHVHEHRLGRERETREKLRHLERLEWFAHHDALTGLPNRTGLERWMLAKRPRGAMRLALLGIDDLGRVNEAFGHRVGDALMVELASRIRSAVSPLEFACRLTADKLVLVLAEDSAIDRLRGLLQASREPVVLADGLVIETGMSGGHTALPAGAVNLSEMLQQVESALIAAKAAGRGQLRCFDSARFARDLRWNQLATRMRSALQGDEFHLVFQPRIRLADGAHVGFEALMRWQAAQESVSPAEFVPVAEESGFILDLGRWAIEQTMRQIAEWRGSQLDPGIVSINLSARQLLEPGLAELIAERITAHALRPTDIELEVTETAAMEQIEAVLPTLRRLAEQGVRLAMDDFGTGYSSLSRLQLLPFPIIKIDLSFVQQLGDAHGDDLMRGLLGLVRSLHRHAVAEGVETAAQRDWLRSAGCEEVQGYLYSRPLAPAQAREWLLQRCVNRAQGGGQA